ncbi:MAG: serine hydrolase [Planctomycetes bacterium]|nr:serine hydrolase [Planctomycetota bacterium]MCH9726941.1 serine hydrolase [Planctomycetota bacterium]MCH9775625.1 serine hydrolase [Planctomycetota bacterium]MCH9789277.1 serine hydrolase [Planctomycetota bacterium]MDF1743433.1 serine hydrolase [Gimesia sp.]
MRQLLLLVLFVAFGTVQLFAEQGFKHEKKIAALVAPYLTNNKVNAISVGVISNGVVWKKHFGVLGENGTPAPNDKTIYEIGSISKVFTSLLLADAVVSGQIKLDDPISVIMKELSATNPKLANITFAQLSHHVSGLPVMPTNFKPADSTNPFAGYNRKLLTDYLLAAKPVRKPGEGYEYSNLGAGLLGDLLSRQAGMSYEALLNQKLTEPLKMSDTTITLSSAQAKHLAPPHNAALLLEKSWDFDSLAGCGAIRSNLDDMLLFAKASLDPPDGQLGKTIELAWKQHKPPAEANLAMGLGWMIAGDRSTRWHNGQTGGYHCMILVNRSLKSATVLLCNTAVMDVDALAQQIFQTSVGMKVKPRTFEKEFKVDPKVAKRLEGKYQLAPGILITVQVKEGRMMAQLTGQQFLALIPKSETEWKYQAVDATLKFELPKTGKSPKVTLHQAGRVMPSPRVAK